ncbi:MAG: hypothetical protein H0X65_02305 [Gemmatimonadetes bacterium]|nr:hypothetical protein [Gemmatimonadota bacterium]
MNPAPFQLSTERGDAVWRRVLGIGLILAVLFHVIVLLAFRSEGFLASPFSAAGPQMGDYLAAAGGGGGMEMVEIRVREERSVVTEEVVPEPVPEPDVITVEPEIAPQPEPAPAPAVTAAPAGPGTAGEGAGLGETTGPGTVEGTGQGAGGTEAEGTSRLIAPVPRGMILPPADRPRSVRGREVTVWLFVTERGRVVADSTRLDPPTPDAGYNRRLRQSAAEWSFEPARRTGRPVAAWYPYQIDL